MLARLVLFVSPMRAWPPIGIVIALACSCGVSGPPPPEHRVLSVGPGGVELPSDLPIATPEGVHVRWARMGASHGRFVATSESAPDELLPALRQAWCAHPASAPASAEGTLQCSARSGIVTVSARRGASELTRLEIHLQVRTRNWNFDSPPETERRVTRPPLPAPPGGGDPECMAALRRRCEAWASAARADAVGCSLDHRGPCVPTTEPTYVSRSLADARDRVLDAARRYDAMGSEGARAETRAQLELELEAARRCVVRARAAGVDATELEALRARVHADLAPRPAIDIHNRD